MPSLVTAKSLLLATIILTAFCCAHAEEAPDLWSGVNDGDSVREVVEFLRANGLQIAYSDAVLTEDIVVTQAPENTDAIGALIDVLRPYELTVFDVDGLYVIGLMKPDNADAIDSTPDIGAVDPSDEPISEIIVAASHYHLVRDMTALPNLIDQRAILQFPDLGDDPLRSVMRLPGAASSGSSARAHLRGATQYETGVVLDGHRLLDPFHVRDYQSLFSAIDVRAVDGVEVYTGGFPVEYGDIAGGLILVDSLEAGLDRHTELGLSVFSTSVLSYGQIADGQADWMFSARRGNLDLVINEDLGEPTYYDVFSKVSVNFSDKTKVSFNGLIIEDAVLVVPASDPDEREESTNDTRNAQIWMTWEQTWNDRLFSRTMASVSDMQSERIASVNDPEKIVGDISDTRDINILRVAQDWSSSIGKSHHLRFGGEFRHLTSGYKYRSNYEYFGIFRDALLLPPSGSSQIVTDIDGDGLAVYLSDRWRINDNVTIDLGVRWDKQTYTDLSDDTQISPRASVRYQLSPASTMRLSWGRFHQSHGIHELQVEDGISNFFPAQRSDHFIVGWEQNFRSDYVLRIEAYQKSEERLRPRFENTLDPFSVVPELEPDRTRVAPDNGTSRGLEVSLEYSPNESQNWWASYALAEADDEIDGASVPRSWDQRHALQIGAAVRSDRWGFSAAIKAHSGWPKTDVRLIEPPGSPNPFILIGPRNTTRYDPFVTLDLRLDYRKTFRSGTFSWFFEIANATNRNNSCCVDFDLDPDGNGGFFLDKKEDYWFPILPATGILWEF